MKLGKADMHIHSNYSDGAPTPGQILDYVEHHTSLDVIAISDHDTLDGALEAKRLYDEGHFRFELVIAEEITSNEGHIVGLFLKKKIEPNRPAKEILKDIRAQGGLAIASHPFYHSKMNHTQYLTMDGIGASTLLKNNEMFDAVEIVNATPTLSDENLAASILNKTWLFNSEVGNSDAHILPAIGMGYTLFEPARHASPPEPPSWRTGKALQAGGHMAHDLRQAILQHQTRAMYKQWSYLGLFKYAYFYFPRGLRLLIHTIIHGGNDRPMDLLEQQILSEER